MGDETMCHSGCRNQISIKHCYVKQPFTQRTSYSDYELRKSPGSVLGLDDGCPFLNISSFSYTPGICLDEMEP